VRRSPPLWFFSVSASQNEETRAKRRKPPHSKSVAGCVDKAGEQDNDPLCENETEPTGLPLFKNVTAASGVDWSYCNGEEFGHCAILEQLGGGIGLIDFDGDGLLDLFVVGGGFFEKCDKDFAPRPKVTTLEAAEDFATRPKSDRRCKILGHPCKLYRNRGNGTFEDPGLLRAVLVVLEDQPC